MNRVQVIGFPHHLPLKATGLFEQNTDRTPHHRVLNGALLAGDQRLQTLQAVRFNILIHLRALGGGGAGAGRIFERIGIAVIDLFNEIQRGLKIGFGLFRETDDEIARQQDIGARRANALDQAQIAFGGMASVHPLEDLVAARLHRKMQIGHQLGAFAMRRDKVVAHVIGMAGGKADAFQPVDIIERPDQPGQCPVAAALARAVIGIHVLAKKGDFAYAALDQVAGLFEDAAGRAAYFGATGIGHHAERTEFVTALLHRQKGGGATRRLGSVAQGVEFVVGGKIGIKRRAPGAHLGLHLGQAVIALRPDHQIDQRLAAHDLFALGLRDTARHADFEIRVRGLEIAKAAQFGIDLFGGFFADVTGVEQDHVGVIGACGFHIARAAHGLCHPLAVIDVHLTAIGLDIEFFHIGHMPGSCHGFRGSDYITFRGTCNASAFGRFLHQKDRAEYAVTAPQRLSCQPRQGPCKRAFGHGVCRR